MRRSPWWAPLVALLILVLTPGSGATQPQTERAGSPERLRAWHFAEGLTRGQFQSYFLAQNLEDRPVSIRAEYQRPDGLRLVQWFGIPPRNRRSFQAGDFLGETAFGVSFYADGDVVVERTILAPVDPADFEELGEADQGASGDGLTTLGFAPDGMRTWHFADGSNFGDLQTFYVVRNVTDDFTTVHATFVTDEGVILERDFPLPPRARLPINTRDMLPDIAFGATFTADRDIVAERTVFSGGRLSPLGGLGFPAGEQTDATTWHFAEGNTREPFSTFFLLFNPNPESATVELIFLGEDGGTRRVTLFLAPFERVAYAAREAVPEAVFGTTIRSTRPIVAERSYYSTGGGLYGNPGYSPGLRADGRTWLFAEGNTTSGIETYFMIRNLGSAAGSIQATFFLDGRRVEQTIYIAPTQRVAFRAGDLLPDATFAARLESDVPLVVERVLYFPGWGAHNAVGVGVPGSQP